MADDHTADYIGGSRLNGHLSEIFSLLEGKWHFNRTIPSMGRVVGQARFAADRIDAQPVLWYREKGKLDYQGASFAASREYLYLFSATGLAVYFVTAGQQGGLFHFLTFSNSPEFSGIWQASAHHLCGQDTYTTHYLFDCQADTFEIRHIVNGPRKNYVSTTVFIKD